MRVDRTGLSIGPDVPSSSPSAMSGGFSPIPSSSGNQSCSANNDNNKEGTTQVALNLKQCLFLLQCFIGIDPKTISPKPVDPKPISQPFKPDKKEEPY